MLKIIVKDCLIASKISTSSKRTKDNKLTILLIFHVLIFNHNDKIISSPKRHSNNLGKRNNNPLKLGKR